MLVLDNDDIIRVVRRKKEDHELNIGQKFNMLTVLSIVKYKKYFKYICKCDCGVEFETYAQAVIKGATQSCGCFHKSGKWRNPDKPRSDIKTGINQSTFNYLVHIYKRNAAARGYVFDLNREEFYNLVQQNCHYCGSLPNQVVKFNKKRHTPPFYYNGLDRKVNEMGYTLDNVVPCCTMCNKAKGTLTEKQFINWLNNLVKFRINFENTKK